MSTPYIKILPNGKPQIGKAEALSILRKGVLPYESEYYKGIIAELDEKIRLADNRVSQGALSNAHGDWYEWMLAIEAWNVCVDNPEADMPLLLPNIRLYDVGRLYKNYLFDLIQDLRQKVLEASTVQLITSNPDFVIINRSLVNEILGPPERISTFTPENISILNNAFQKYSERCSFEDIVGYISVKTSLRPDRVYPENSPSQ